MSYQKYLSKAQLNSQLLIGLKKHLLITQNTSLHKQTRLESLNILIELLEYVSVNINEAISADEQVIYGKFFSGLLTKVAIAKVKLHTSPVKFDDEIGFISVMLSLNDK